MFGKALRAIILLLRDRTTDRTLSFEGDGKIKVDAARLVQQPQVRKQLKEIRRMAADDFDENEEDALMDPGYP